MLSTISELMVPSGPDVYYDERFRNMFEDHIEFVRRHETTDTVEISPADAYSYEGDLYGLLHKYGSPRELHWVIMRVNGYSSPMEYVHEHTSLILPSKTVIDDLVRVFRVNHRIR
jgi:hypothetical protein